MLNALSYSYYVCCSLIDFQYHRLEGVTVIILDDFPYSIVKNMLHMEKISSRPVARQTHKFTWNVDIKLNLNLNIVISYKIVIPVQTVL